MSISEVTTQAVRLALNMSQMRAEYSSRNIAGANFPGAMAQHPDFMRSQALLDEADALRPGESLQLQGRLSGENMFLRSGPDVNESTNQLDVEVADMVGASLAYQTLSQSLSRYFGLMRLAVTGRG